MMYSDDDKNHGPLSTEALSKVLEVAHGLYEYYGEHAMSLERLSEAVNIPVALLEEQFTNQAGLSHEVMVYCFQQQAPLMAALNDAQLSGEAIITLVLDYCATMCDALETVGWLGLWVLEARRAGSIPKSLLQYYHEHWRFIFSYCAHIYHKPPQARIITAHAMALWHGLFFMREIGSVEYCSQWFVQALRRLFMPDDGPPPDAGLPGKAVNDADYGAKSQSAS